MKKVLFVCLLAFVAVAGFAVRAFVDHSAAKASQLQGVYVFVDSEPITEYDYLGTVKSSVSLGGSQYTDIRDRLIRKLKDDYPQANGAIFRFKSGSTDQADAIRFKD